MVTPASAAIAFSVAATYPSAANRARAAASRAPVVAAVRSAWVRRGVATVATPGILAVAWDGNTLRPVSLERRYAFLSALRWLPIGLALPFLTLLPLARGLSLTTVGVVIAVHGIVIFVCEVPSGAIADTIGRKRTLLAGGVLTTIAVGLFGAATATAGFVAAFVAMGVGRALISGALVAWFVAAAVLAIGALLAAKVAASSVSPPPRSSG